jgi:EAL domain-containing protein (putative c-di-GMP-specific phosphodiesterase class I)
MQEMMSQEKTNAQTIIRALKTVHDHLKMDVVFITAFNDAHSVVRKVYAPNKEGFVTVNQVHSSDDKPCLDILVDKTPTFLPEVSSGRKPLSLPFSESQHVGCVLAVPIVLTDGRTYGMLCGLRIFPHPDLRKSDLEVMDAFAGIIAQRISSIVLAAEEVTRKRTEIRAVIKQGQFAQVFQPVWNLEERRVTGYECLTRFNPTPYRTPDKWFNFAHDVGVGNELEIATIKGAMAQLSELRGDLLIGLNISPTTLMCAQFSDVMEQIDPSRVVLEITEHQPIEDIDALLNVVAPYRMAGLQLAIDDVGARYAGMQMIVGIKPDIMKLDMSLIRDIDAEPAKRALARAMVSLASELGAKVVAEGIETQQELRTVMELGIERGQGYLLGRPVCPELALDLLAHEGSFERMLELRERQAAGVA